MDLLTDPLLPATTTTDNPDRANNLDFSHDVLAATFETMRRRPNEDPAHEAIHEAATYTALRSLQARDPIELMFAAHIVASHHATMECFRRAMRATDNADVASRMHRNAVLLSRMMADVAKELAARQQPQAGGKTP
jgi:hypothetical protein